MIYYMRGMEKPYIMAIDVEYDKDKIIQLGSILLKNIGGCLYQPCRSLNVYIAQTNICQFIQDYTNITKEFMKEYGDSLEEAQSKWSAYIDGLKTEDVLVVSHGINQDSIIMRSNGFDIDCFEHWCTYNHAKWVFKRQNNVGLADILQESGLIPVGEHNAYGDAFSTLSVLSFLLKLEGE